MDEKTNIYMKAEEASLLLGLGNPKEEKVTIEITRDQAEDLAFMYEIEFLDMIRNDEGIDNLRWVRERLKLYDKLLRASGKEGLGGYDE